MIWSLIPDWLITAAAAGLTGFVALLVGRWTGKREGASRAESDALKDHIETRNRMDDADTVGDNPDAARRWLSERSKR